MHCASRVEPRKGLWTRSGEGGFDTYALPVSLPHRTRTWCKMNLLTVSQSNLIPYKAKFGDAARTEYDKDLAAIVLADKPDLLVCAGWMSILADTFLDPLAEAHVPIINLHPALPVG